MTDRLEEVENLNSEATNLEHEAVRLRSQAMSIIREDKLCARGGDPISRGRGFCCGQPYECLERQP